jgi:hypothetical protein
MVTVLAVLRRLETKIICTEPPMYHGPEHYLKRDTNASRLLAHARLLTKLSRRFTAIAPGGLGRAARVANFKSGVIVIHTENGAVAAKIRQMGRRLCDELSREGVECNQLEVKVQPQRSLREIHPASVKPLSTKAFDSMQATANELPPGPLRHALEILLKSAARRE